jgi:signal transduction histidine kinase
MSTSAAARVRLPAPPRRAVLAGLQPEAEPRDLAACLEGPNGLDLVVEMAHDLRSPLTAILFLTEQLKGGQNGPMNDDQRRGLGLIYSAALSLCATASDVLELARGGNRLVDREPAPFSLVEVFTSVRSMILPIAAEKGLEVRLVQPVQERRIGHARALSRVLLNLATNAVKFTDQGYIEISGRPVDSTTRLEFSVRDSGPGIEPETLRVLYQPFRRSASGPEQHFSSSGLGLVICRKLVKAMGSQLKVETCPGSGTRFLFRLDLPPADDLA